MSLLECRSFLARSPNEGLFILRHDFIRRLLVLDLANLIEGLIYPFYLRTLSLHILHQLVYSISQNLVDLLGEHRLHTHDQLVLLGLFFLFLFHLFHQHLVHQIAKLILFLIYELLICHKSFCCSSEFIKSSFLFRIFSSSLVVQNWDFIFIEDFNH